VVQSGAKASRARERASFLLSRRPLSAMLPARPIDSLL
jgi:hypothetical protein